MSSPFSDKENEWQKWVEAYLSGEADEATRFQLQQWTAASDGNRQIFLSLLKSYKMDQPDWLEEVSVTLHWEELKERMEAGPALPERTAGGQVFWRRGLTSLIVVIIFTCFFLLQLSKPVYQQFEAVNTAMPLILPDSSRVLLNVHSSIRFKQGFGRSHRQLEQSGQVYYEVTGNSDIPLVIKTDWSETTVLGTSFDLQAYPGNVREQLSVLSGKVQYTPTANVGMQHIITAGSSVTYNKTKPEVTISNTVAAPQLHWSGRVVFDNDLDAEEDVKGK